MQQDVLDPRIQLGRRRRALTEPPDVLAKRGPHAGRAPALARSPVEHRPHPLTREPETLEPFALVAVDARGQEILLPDSHRQVFALQELERREHAGRPDETVIGMQVVTPDEERRELLGRCDRAGYPARVHLTALDLVEHRDVDELRR